MPMSLPSISSTAFIDYNDESTLELTWGGDFDTNLAEQGSYINAHGSNSRQASEPTPEPGAALPDCSRLYSL